MQERIEIRGRSHDAGAREIHLEDGGGGKTGKKAKPTPRTDKKKRATRTAWENDLVGNLNFQI